LQDKSSEVGTFEVGAGKHFQNKKIKNKTHIKISLINGLS
jgi:hypothetical protein